MRLEVPISQEKLHWIHWLGHTDVSRVFLQFESRIWEPLGLSPEVLSDGLTMFSESPTLSQGGDAAILDNYVTGPRARTLGRLSEKARIAKVLDELERIFPGAREQFVVGVSEVWHLDPWAGGGYAFLRPGEVLESLSACQSLEASGRLHFAGDHTSTLPGWMQGALASGQRVAREVNAAGSPA
jgi:monoamine oxidase